MPVVFDIYGEKTQNVLGTLFQNVLGNQGHVVGFGIIIVEQAFPQAAARGNDALAFCLRQQAVDDRCAGEDDVSAFFRQTGNVHAFFQRGALQLFKQRAEALGAEDVIVDPAGWIIPAPLDHLGNGTGRAAHTDQGQAGVFQPGILFHTGGDKEVDVAVGRWRHRIADMENIRCVYGPQRDGNGLHQFPVPEQDQFCGAAAQVKDDTVFHGQGVDHAQITELRFHVAGNNMKPDSGLFKYFTGQLAAVFGIADGGRGYGDDLVCLILPAHVSKRLHDLQRAVEGFFGKQPFAFCFLGKPQHFFLIEDHVVGAAFINMTDDKTGRVRADVDDCNSLHNMSPQTVSGNYL